MRASIEVLGPLDQFGRFICSFGAHYGFRISRLVAIIGWRHKSPWRQQDGQINSRNNKSNGRHLSDLYFSSISRYLQRQNYRDSRLRPTRWLLTHTIANICIVSSSHVSNKENWRKDLKWIAHDRHQRRHNWTVRSSHHQSRKYKWNLVWNQFTKDFLGNFQKVICMYMWGYIR